MLTGQAPKELIDAADEQMAGVRDAAEVARKAEADRLAKAQKKAGEATLDENRLHAQIDFASLQGKLDCLLQAKLAF